MMELTHAEDARVGFLDPHDNILAEDPLMPGEHALYVTSQDFEGVTLIGTLDELNDFVDRLNRVLGRANADAVGWPVTPPAEPV